MSESAFIVRVPEAEACVGELRRRFDATVGLGIPAHVTVLFPFMSPQRVTPAVLCDIQLALDEVPAFPFELTKVALFPATAYLAPEPTAPFIALTQSLVRRFPEFLPFRGEHASIVPHLTVAHGSAAEAEFAAAELTRLLQSHGAIRGVCSSVALLENSSGFWKEMHVFELPRCDG